VSDLSRQLRSCSTYTHTTTGGKRAVNTGNEGADRIEELEKELESANLVIAKFAKYIIEYDDIDQYSHQAVHRWEELKWFADDISNQAKAPNKQGSYDGTPDTV
jgi:hypothetical protein